MAVTWLSGGEHQVSPLHATSNAIVQAILTNAPTLDSTTVKTGTRSIRFAPTSAVDWGIQMTSASVQIHVFSFWVNWETLPSGAGTDPRGILCQANVGSGSSFIGIGVDPADNSLRSWTHDGVTFTWRNSGPVVSTGTWYHVDCLIKTNGTTWSVDYRVNGTAYGPGQWTGKSATNGVGNFNAFCSTATRHVLLVDDFLYSNTEADYPFGPHSIVSLVTSGAASHQSITLAEWQYTDNFSSFTTFASTSESDSASRLDDLNTSDGIRLLGAAAGTAGNARWNLSNPTHPSQLPIALRSMCAIWDDTAGVNQITVRIRSAGGTTSDVFAGDPTNTTPQYAALLSTSVPGGSGWTMADVEGLTLEVDSTDCNPDLRMGGWVGEMAYKNGSLLLPNSNLLVIRR